MFDWPNNNNTNAHCGNASHEHCHVDRVSYSSSRANRRGQGRPLGALALWLAMSDSGSRDEHQAINRSACSRSARKDRRLSTEALELNLERDDHDGEEDTKLADLPV